MGVLQQGADECRDKEFVELLAVTHHVDRATECAAGDQHTGKQPADSDKELGKVCGVSDDVYVCVSGENSTR